MIDHEPLNECGQIAEGACAVIAAHYRLDRDDVLDAIARLPTAELLKLDSADGWEAVGAHVAETLGASGETEPLSLFPLMAMAAQGHLYAQRMLALEGERVVAAGLADPILGLFEARVFARLAAAHGRIEDRQLCARIVSKLGAACWERGLEGEALACEGEILALVGMIADQGSERAAEVLNVASENSTAEAAEQARWFEREWRKVDDVRQ